MPTDMNMRLLAVEHWHSMSDNGNEELLAAEICTCREATMVSSKGRETTRRKTDTERWAVHSTEQKHARVASENLNFRPRSVQRNESMDWNTLRAYTNIEVAGVCVGFVDSQPWIWNRAYEGWPGPLTFNDGDAAGEDDETNVVEMGRDESTA
ncbi:hypothetical protein PM082_006141 [Marasmius tenuissimus]|nr:hypothetical protein PM082_006141 [Marasmius tenuissimus]